MKKLNNKTLGIVLVLLVVVFGATKLFRASDNSNLQSELIRLDTAQITRMVIFPQAQGHRQLTLLRKAGRWQAIQGNRAVPARGGTVRALLGTLAYVGVKRMVTRNKSDWKDYHMTDSLATRLQVYAGDRLLLDCRIGALSEGTGPYAQTATYVRLDSAATVYQTEGYLAATANKGFNSWRNHDFLKVDPATVTRLQFKYPADQGFTVQKQDSLWKIGNRMADSTRMAAYLNKLRSREMSDFADGFTPDREPSMSLDIQAAGAVRIAAWPSDSGWVLQSSLRPGVYFYDRDSSAVKALLVHKDALLPPAP